jgi:hypothetical protein
VRGHVACDGDEEAAAAGAAFVDGAFHRDHRRVRIASAVRAAMMRARAACKSAVTRWPHRQAAGVRRLQCRRG